MGIYLDNETTKMKLTVIILNQNPMIHYIPRVTIIFHKIIILPNLYCIISHRIEMACMSIAQIASHTTLHSSIISIN